MIQLDHSKYVAEVGLQSLQRAELFWCIPKYTINCLALLELCHSDPDTQVKAKHNAKLAHLMFFLPPFYGWCWTASRLQSHYKERVHFLPPSPRNSSHSFYQTRKDERLSQPWGHPVVLNLGPLDWLNSVP